jgi:hypothetical protein
MSVYSDIVTVYICGSEIVAVYVCGQWHCCSLSLWTVALLLFMSVESGIVAVYVL